MNLKVLITGTAGFIGFHFARKLINEGIEVIGLDNINNYYDVNLKFARLEQTGISRNINYGEILLSSKYDNYRFIKCDLCDQDLINHLFEREQPEIVVNLAAQAGVRYSLDHPKPYIDSNIVGFINILEACKQNKIKHLLFASSSSVYGLNEKMPFSTDDNVDHPINLYAATKKSNELLAHTYSYLFGLPVTGLRFFSAYGTWGRPDMALYIFAKAILNGETIKIYNDGNMMRDFTYIDDIVHILGLLLNKIPSGNTKWSAKKPNPSSSMAPYRIYNVGNSSPVSLMDFVKEIEMALGKKAKTEYMPMQPGDISSTWADVTSLSDAINFKASTSISTGVKKFVEWYLEYNKLHKA